MTSISRGRKAGSPALQTKITESFSDMSMVDIQKYLKTRGLDISGSSEVVDSKTGEKTLYIGIEKFGKATYSGNLASALKGKIRWDHLVLDGVQAF